MYSRWDNVADIGEEKQSRNGTLIYIPPNKLHIFYQFWMGENEFESLQMFTFNKKQYDTY